jgi:S-adenosylmethionine:tRNA ribosyltransferase-isomerase
MDSERYSISPETADAYNRTRSGKGRIIGVGTTTVRALESCWQLHKSVRPVETDTDIFIYPPYEFKSVDCIVTNFHLPRSTLFMMISAFCGLEKLKFIYEQAIAERYRFYSYGDAMLIL